MVVGGGLLVLAIVINLFFLPGQSAVSQKDSIIQGGGNRAVPTAPALPQQNPAAAQGQK